MLSYLSELLLLPLVLLAALVALLGDVLAGLLGRARRLARRTAAAPGRRPVSPAAARDATQASIVILNWNGRELLAESLPPVVAAVQQAGGEHEIIVVDNGSTDGSVDYVRSAFPAVRVLPLPRNLGFGAGNNAGVQAARYDIVVLLNNDMIVDAGFLPPLLEPFADQRVFAVSAQIFMAGGRPRQETGRTLARLRDGRLETWHGEVKDGEAALQPCLWAGGGSSAFDRRRFLELGGFDALYAPFYVEDVDLSYRAWKRGWSVLLAPRSIVHHKHRSSTSRLGSDYVETVHERNRRLFVWHNISDVAWTLSSLLRLPGDLGAALREGRHGERDAILGALRLLPAALWRRWRERADPASTPAAPVTPAVETTPKTTQSRPSATEPAHADGLGVPIAAISIARAPAVETTPKTTQSRPSATEPAHEGGLGVPIAATSVARLSDRDIFRSARYRYYYKDRFDPPPARSAGGRKKILILTPYFPLPLTHGGAVRMFNLIKQLSQTNHVDVLSFIDYEHERRYVPQLEPHCRRVRVVFRKPAWGRYDPLRDRSWHIEQFETDEMWQALLEMLGDESYDILQVEYTQMGMYHPGGRRLRTTLIEHDIYFRSFWRREIRARGRPRLQDIVDALKLVRFEIESCRKYDLIQTMSETDAAYLAGYAPDLRPRLVEVANGVDAGYYMPAETWPGGTDLLFVGSYRHTPNREAVRYFLGRVFPLILREIPAARLVIAGDGDWAEMDGVAGRPQVSATGFVEDMRPYLQSCAAEVVPVLSGSGTRIKIFEALAAGIPVISTTLGCEGIAVRPEESVLTGDTPEAFAAATVRLLRDPALAERLRRNGRRLAEERYDWRTIAARLDGLFNRMVEEK